MAGDESEPEANGRIDELPDHILSSIVSCLDVEDAIRTRVLGSRWRHLWKHASHLRFDCDGVLGFDISDFSPLSSIRREKVLWMKHTGKFIRSVNKILRCHEGKGVKTFEVGFPLDRKHAKTIDKWVRFALSSGTKKLRLALFADFALAYTKPYKFPLQLFTGGRRHTLTCLSLQYCLLVPPPSFDGFKSLKVFELDIAYITDEGLADLVSCCSALERLSVNQCLMLSKIKISLPCSRLKILDVFSCKRIEEIDISALNLETLQYSGGMINFNFKNSPRLTKAEIFFPKCNWSSLLIKLPIQLPQLETLFIQICKQPEVGFVCSKLFSNLNQLTLDYRASKDDDILWMVSLLNAAPVLKSLDVQIRDLLSSSSEEEDVEPREIRRLPIGCSHEHIKNVLLSGFVGSVRQIELAIYLLRSSAALESMVISPIQVFYIRRTGGVAVQQCGVSDEVARRCCDKATKFICGELPHGVKLTIL